MCADEKEWNFVVQAFPSLATHPDVLHDLPYLIREHYRRARGISLKARCRPQTIDGLPVPVIPPLRRVVSQKDSILVTDQEAPLSDEEIIRIWTQKKIFVGHMFKVTDTLEKGKDGVSITREVRVVRLGRISVRWNVSGATH